MGGRAFFVWAAVALMQVLYATCSAAVGCRQLSWVVAARAAANPWGSGTSRVYLPQLFCCCGVSVLGHLQHSMYAMCSC
jgi:hypothetical protein